MNMGGFPTEVFQALSDSTRLRIMRLFVEAQSTLCVCEIVDALEVPQYNVSRHLKTLKQVGLLVETKEGRWVYYGLPPQPNLLNRLLVKAIQSINTPIINKDKRELIRRLRMRVRGKCLKGIQKPYLGPNYNE